MGPMVLALTLPLLVFALSFIVTWLDRRDEKRELAEVKSTSEQLAIPFPSERPAQRPSRSSRPPAISAHP